MLIKRKEKNMFGKEKGEKSNYKLAMEALFYHFHLILPIKFIDVCSMGEAQHTNWEVRNVISN